MRIRHKLTPILETLQLTALRHRILVHETLGHHHVGQRGQHRHIGARFERQVVRGLHMGRVHEINAARIDHDQFRTLAQAPFHARGKHRMGIGGVGPHHDDDIAGFNRLEGLGAR